MQLPLFGQKSRLEEQFWAFHLKHPQVYRALVNLARQWRLRRGLTAKIGIGALYERARWEIAIDGLADEEPPRLSNNHRAYYARLILLENPDLTGIFKLKKQRFQATFGPDQRWLEDGDHMIHK
jgi:hypothetical protein